MAEWIVPSSLTPLTAPPAGADLRAHRRAAGLTQGQLARLAGCRRGAVAYWERKQVLGPPFGLVGRLARLVGMYDYENSMRARAHARWDVTQTPDPLAQPDAARPAQPAALKAQLFALEASRHEREMRRQDEREARRAAERGAQLPTPEPARCGALTRKGAACRHPIELGRARCKFHGGMSTGPRTPEGRARIGEAQKRRWAAWRLTRPL